MHANDAIIKTVRAVLEREARINLHRHPVTIRRDGDVLVLEGEVYDIAAKKLALGLAAAVAGVRGIIDRLHLVPSERKGDGAIRDGCVKFILGEPTLRNCEVRIHHKGRVDALRRVEPDAAGNIEIAVQDGVITLDGEVGSLSHKRIAGVLAWWTPGRRDVVDGLEVVPPQVDSDAEIEEALRLVFEANPVLNPDQIRISSSNRAITLDGHVATDAEKALAELDAWYLFGVDKVVNRLQVIK
ncbi:MAG: BON domain-containing protein [Betaproteobacteria bacterium]|nr:BON domain-containing protein [Betaproteobacteria bacterium]